MSEKKGEKPEEIRHGQGRGGRDVTAELSRHTTENPTSPDAAVEVVL